MASPSGTIGKIRKLVRDQGVWGAITCAWEKSREYRRIEKLVNRAGGPGRDGRKLVDFIFSEEAAYIRPYQVPEEIRRLLDMVIELRPKRVLEIGTAQGGTLFLWTRVAADDATIASIDLPGGEFGGGYPVWRARLYRLFARPGQVVELIRADSHSQTTFDQMKASLGAELLDFLFIDGDHTYEGVRRDFELYSPLVRPGGLIAMHDVAVHADQSCQVHRFWEEVKLRFEHWELIEDREQGWAGIGVVKGGTSGS